MRMLPPPRADRLSSCPPELAMSEKINVAEAYDKGRALFMGIELLVAPGALVPRPETELLGASAIDSLRRLNVSAPRVIDMCCGAGNPACAVSLNIPGIRNLHRADPPKFLGMKPLPSVFALCCFEGDRWLAVSPSDWSLAAGRTFERRQLRTVDSGELYVDQVSATLPRAPGAPPRSPDSST
jgi:hypothetical protein